MRETDSRPPGLSLKRVVPRFTFSAALIPLSAPCTRVCLLFAVLAEIDAGNLPLWTKMQAPTIAREYWQLPPDALVRDVFNAIRADEAHHRHVNHTFAGLKEEELKTGKPVPNPYQADERLPEDKPKA